MRQKSVCVCVCVPQHKRFQETIEIIIVKLGTVTASGMRMHHLFIILTFTFMQGHIDHLNHGTNQCLIISETVQLKQSP